MKQIKEMTSCERYVRFTNFITSKLNSILILCVLIYLISVVLGVTSINTLFTFTILGIPLMYTVMIFWIVTGLAVTFGLHIYGEMFLNMYLLSVEKETKHPKLTEIKKKFKLMSDLETVLIGVLFIAQFGFLGIFYWLAPFIFGSIVLMRLVKNGLDLTKYFNDDNNGFLD